MTNAAVFSVVKTGFLYVVLLIISLCFATFLITAFMSSRFSSECHVFPTSIHSFLVLYVQNTDWTNMVVACSLAGLHICQVCLNALMHHFTGVSSKWSGMVGYTLLLDRPLPICWPLSGFLLLVWFGRHFTWIFFRISNILMLFLSSLAMVSESVWLKCCGIAHNLTSAVFRGVLSSSSDPVFWVLSSSTSQQSFCSA